MLDLSPLNPEFRAQVEILLAKLASKGVTMRPYCAIRDPFDQSRLWRQSRTSEQIRVACQRLRQQGAPRIAACLESVGPQHGKPVTNALPGYSWHQYGEAVDCFLVDRDGHADWDASAAGYAAYCATANELGLRTGRDWGDTPHIQMRHHEPHQMHTPPELEHMLAERFPNFAKLK